MLSGQAAGYEMGQGETRKTAIGVELGYFGMKHAHF